jgi:D-amino-acid oxidase
MAMPDQTSIAVIGSGTIGMTTAWQSSEDGFKVTIVSKDSFSDTTSAVAAAFWYPYKAEPADKVSQWAQDSLSVYRDALKTTDSGVVWHRFTEFLHPDARLPWWTSSVDNFEFDEQVVELPAGPRKICRYQVPIIDTTRYLPFLLAGLNKLGVQFLQRELKSIDEAVDR